jgi:hypothetical protein
MNESNLNILLEKEIIIEIKTNVIDLELKKLRIYQ